MDMKLLLFIFTVSWSVTGGESALNVSLHPRFPSSRVYVSDEVTLRCEEGDTVLNSDVTWYKDNKILTGSAEVHIPAAQVTDSGLYACEKGGVKSDSLEITVLNMVPQASLSVINTVNTVMGAGEAVLMKLFVKEGLNGWRCRYSEGADEYWESSLDGESNKTSVVIHAEVRVTPGRTYWCMNTKEEREDCPRSNTIKLTVTGKSVALQVSNRPAWKGDKVSLACEVWGGPEVKNAVFSHNGIEIHRSSQKSYVIYNVSQSNAGTYTCAATYAYKHINTEAADHFHSSDGQSLRVIDGPPVARIDCQSQTCSCSDCKDALTPVGWEFSADAGATETEILQETESNMMSQEYGRPYRCAALFTKGRSRFSNSCDKSSAGINGTVLVVVVLFVLGMLFLLLGLWMCKRRRESGKKRMKGLEDGADGGYEEVGSEKKKAEKEGEYELLKVDQGEKDKAQYETLQGKGKEGGKAEGEYEALKGGEAEGGVYHTVKEKGEGKGHYEALKTAQVEVYHTLGKEQGAGEAEEQKAKEESPYEELKAEKK